MRPILLVPLVALSCFAGSAFATSWAREPSANAAMPGPLSARVSRLEEQVYTRRPSLRDAREAVRNWCVFLRNARPAEAEDFVVRRLLEDWLLSCGAFRS